MRTRTLLGVLIILVTGGFTLYFLAFRTPAAGPQGGGFPGSSAGGGLPPTVVATTPVEQGALTIRASFVGTLQAGSFAELYAKSNGPIVEIRAELGDNVKAGQVLARIDNAEVSQRVRQNQAAVRMAEATKSQREATIKTIQSNADRVASLYEKQIVSQQEYDASQSELLSAEAQLQLAEAQIEQANANLSMTQVQLDNTNVTAPFTGVIAKRYLDLGALASSNSPVFSIADLSTIKMTIALVDKDAVRIRVGQPAIVTTEAIPGQTFEGKVARIAPVFDPETNTAEAEIEIQNRDGLLKAGFFASAAIAYHTEDTALLIPKSAVMEDERSTAVFVAQEKPEEQRWVAARIPIRVIGEGDEGEQQKVAIEGALSVGDKVITLGQATLRDGAPVRLTDSTPSNPAMTPAGSLP